MISYTAKYPNDRSMKKAISEHLVHLARKGHFTTYSGIVETLELPLPQTTWEGRSKLATLMEEIGSEVWEKHRIPITVLLYAKNKFEPSEGWYKLMHKLGHPVNVANKYQKAAFLNKWRTKTYQFYATR